MSLNVYVSILLIWLLYGCNAGKTDWDGKRIEQTDLNVDPVLIENAAQLAWLASLEKCVYRYKKDEKSGNPGLPVVYRPDLGQ